MNRDIFRLAKKIKGELKKGVENYYTGLVGEQIIVASYKTMPTEKLEKMRFIINKIIKKRIIGEKIKAKQWVKVKANDDTPDNRNAGKR